MIFGVYSYSLSINDFYSKIVKGADKICVKKRAEISFGEQGNWIHTYTHTCTHKHTYMAAHIWLFKRGLELISS